MKQLLDLASNKASPVVLSGYATASISNVYYGIGVSITVGAGFALYPSIKKVIQKWWKERNAKVMVVEE